MKNMRYIAVIFILVVSFLSCSDTKNNDGSKTGGETGKSATPVTKRKKIGKLTPASYYRVSIVLMEEQRKWNREFREYMQNKRKAFYESFGITEKQYTDYSMNNQDRLLKYRRRNPSLNRKMKQFRNMYTQ